MPSGTGAGGGSAQLASLVRRLRSWPASSWRHGDRVRLARDACQRLADLAAEHESRPALTVPDHGVSALADQLDVLATDAQRAGVPAARIAPVLAELAGGLGLRR